MDIYLVEWSKPGDNETHSTAWDTEASAEQAAAADIMQALVYWDLTTDPDAKFAAIDINNAAAAGNYPKVRRLFNDWNAGLDFEYQEFYNVVAKNVLDIPPGVTMIAIPPDEEDDEEEELESIQAVLSYECPCGMVRADCDYHKPC